MKDIREILTVLTSKKLKHPPSVSSTDAPYDLVYRLYKNCLDGKYQTDEDAALDLYQASPNDNRYQITKSRVKQRLMEELTQSSFNHGRELPYTPFVIESQKVLVGIKMLLSFGVKRYPIAEVKRLLAKASLHTVTEIEIECYRLLKEYYWFKGAKKEFESYAVCLRKAVQRYIDELRAEELHELLAFPFTLQKQPSEELIKTSSIYKQELDTLRKRTQTYRLQLAYFRFNILYAQINLHYLRVIHFCEAFESFLEGTVLATESQVGECALSKAEAQLFNRQYDDALASIERALSLFPPRGVNWHLAQSIHFILLMHCDRFDEAGAVLRVVVDSTFFSSATEQFKEEWLIYDAYYKYLTTESGQKTSPEFFLYKFLNEVPVFSQDKKGANISIIILQVLWLLKEQNYDKLLTIQKSIENYMTRYLRDKEYRSRSAIFLNILLVIIRNDFQISKIEKKIGSLLEQLHECSGHRGVEPLEVYPFDKLCINVLRNPSFSTKV